MRRVRIFYQSPSGGRVFFDELGPPWPKHPCTDYSSRPGSISPASSNASQQTSYAWQQAGWQPFIIGSVTRFSKKYLSVTGALQGQRLSFYVSRVDEQHRYHHTFSENSLARIKKGLTDNVFQLSILLPDGSQLTLDALN